MSDCLGPPDTPFIDFDKLPFIEQKIKSENNILYNIKIFNAKKYLIVEIISIKDFLEINYRNEYTFEKLSLIDNCFKSFKSIEEIYTGFFQNIKNNQIKILENEYKINLVFKFEYYFGKTKEIKFNFNDSNLNIKNSFFNLYDKIQQKKERNKELEEELNKINTKLNIKQINVENYERRINDKIKELKNNKKEINKKFEEEELLIENINEKIKIFQKKINENLIKELKIIKNSKENENSFFNLSTISIILTIIICFICGKISLEYRNDMINQLESLDIKINVLENNFNYTSNILSDIKKKFKSFNNKNNYLDNNKINDIYNQFNTINNKFSDMESLFKNINTKFNDMENQVKSVNNKYNNTDNQFQPTNNKYKNIDKKFISINNTFNDMKNQFKSINNFFEFFVPINISDFNIFKSFINIGIMHFFKKEIKYFKLLFQLSKDGEDIQNFHKKCDSKNFTITLVITDHNKIFGGFTESAWDQSEKRKYGNKGFLFSINNKEIYYPKNESYIYCSKWCGPNFSNGFHINLKTGLDLTDTTYYYSKVDNKYSKVDNKKKVF